jgi:hypothetical protein
MELLISLLTQWRRMMLSRQADAVRQAVMGLNPEQRQQAADLTLTEIQNAARLPVPHLHGVTETSHYRPWSSVASTAAGRVKDRSIQLRQRSIAMWLAVVYHETRGVSDEGLLAVHRDVLGILRELKAHRLNEPTERAWFNKAA